MAASRVCGYMFSFVFLCILCAQSIAGGRGGHSAKRKTISVYRSVKRPRILLLQQEFMLEPSAYVCIKPKESLLRVREVLVVPCAQKSEQEDAQESDSEKELVVGRTPVATVLAFMQQLERERQQELRQE